MIKRILKSNLFYLLLCIILCSSTIISFCLISTEKMNEGKKYHEDVSLSSNEIVYSQFYKVEMMDIYTSSSYDAFISENSNLFASYNLDESFINQYTEVSKGQIIGKKNGMDVLADYDGYVLNKKLSETGIIIDLYNYNQFSLLVEVTEGQYAKNEFNSNEKYVLNCDGKQIEVEFSSYDISNYQENKKIYAVFLTNNCTMILSSNSNVVVQNVDLKYSNAFVLDSSLFDDRICGKSFIRVENGKINYVTIYCNDIVDGRAIIESLSENYTLHKGDILYAI